MAYSYFQVGIGLGPTLEFYTLVSAELQHMALNIWRGEMVESLDPLTGQLKCLILLGNMTVLVLTCLKVTPPWVCGQLVKK